MHRYRLATVAALLALSGQPFGRELGAQDAPATLRLDFGGAWADRWTEVKLARRANRFIAVELEGAAALKVESAGSASALWHPVGPAAAQGGIVSWRWRVDRPLTGNGREREKRGDDYAARVFVIFGGEPFARGTRAICYVWAASERLGAVYPNPYFPEVATVVLRSGDARAGDWVAERRDVIRDYRDAFDEAPGPLVAVAVMVDTDNTGGRATAWFADIVVEPAASDTSSREPASRR
jgi:hypothetical protein